MHCSGRQVIFGQWFPRMLGFEGRWYWASDRRHFPQVAAIVALGADVVVDTVAAAVVGVVVA